MTTFQNLSTTLLLLSGCANASVVTPADADGGAVADSSPAAAVDAAPADGSDATATEGDAADAAPRITCTKTLSPGSAIDVAFDALSPGDALCLHTGHYGGPTSNIQLAASGTPGHPITLTTAPGEAPATIEGAFTVGVNSSGGHQHYVAVSHLNFDLDYMGTRVNGTAVGCTTANVQGLQLNGGDLTFEYNDVSEASVSPELRDTALGVNFVQGLVEPNIIIRYNKIHDYGACDHFDHGMYLDFISSGEVSGNWVYNGGCSYGLGGDHTLGCGAGIQLWVSPSGLTVHGNVIDGTGVGFYYSGSGNDIYDNVVINTRGMYSGTGSLQAAVTYDGYGGSSSNKFDDNDSFNAGPLCADCTATSSGNVSVDPLFTNPAAHDYSLKAGSPVTTYKLWDGTGR